MIQKYWLDLGPSLLVGGGVIVSTLIAVLAAQSGWLVLTGPLLLALTALSADAWASRRRGNSSRPSRPALLLGGAILLAGLIVTLRDPGLVKMLIPIIGGAAWVSILRRSGSRRKACARF